MSGTFRTSYNELLDAGIKYTHSGQPVSMRYRETEEYPSLEQIQRINEDRALKHHVLQIKLSEMKEDRPSTPPAFKELKSEEIQGIVNRLNDRKTSASTGQIDDITAARLERASKKDDAKVFGDKKASPEELKEQIDRLTTPNVMSRLRSEAVQLQYGDRQKSCLEDKKGKNGKEKSEDEKPKGKSEEAKNKEKEKKDQKLQRSESKESVNSLDSAKTT